MPLQPRAQRRRAQLGDIRPRLGATTGPGRRLGRVVVDLATSPLVDHTTMERLHDLEGELAHEGKGLIVRGADQLTKLSEHPAATRRSVLPPAAA